MSHRIERVNQLIRQEISELLRRDIKDPRLGEFVSITRVETTSDLRSAKIYVSGIFGEERKKEIIAALESASGFLHNELMKRFRMRRVPDLTFQWDPSIEQGARVLELLDKVKSEPNK
jgi:ribosome-binding factor A